MRAFDAIVVGSGIGGLAAAAGLAKCGHRVLVLEQHFQLGGLTQTFSRREYTFSAGFHYTGSVGESPDPENLFGHLLRWLGEGRVLFAAIGSPYDIVRLPGFEFRIEAPRAAYVASLKAAFPDEAAAIDRYFAACDDMREANAALFKVKAAPAPIAAFTRWRNAKRIRRALTTTMADVIGDIRDDRLAALLATRWGDYGLPPSCAPFAVHALIIGSYFNGAYYPVGGPGIFAEALGETVRAAGGELRTQAAVSAIRVDDGRVSGVRLADGTTIDAPVVVSAMGAHNTVAALPANVATEWHEDVEALKPSISYVTLYLGFHGDIRTHGATAANVWIYESNDIGRVWEHPADEESPALFVSFSSLKDPAHLDHEHHTAEVVAFCRWEDFSAWSESTPGSRPEEYQAVKEKIEKALLAQFTRHFPELAPLIDFHEISTPLSQATFVRADHGATYGLEMSAERMGHRALNVRTPVPGLWLAGQDAASLGIPGAFMGGFMAAASIEPRLWRQMRQ